jgi:hypothetical protein
VSQFTHDRPELRENEAGIGAGQRRPKPGQTEPIAETIVFGENIIMNKPIQSHSRLETSPARTNRGRDQRRFAPARVTTAERLIQIAIDTAAITAITAGVLLASAPWVLR